jgi:type IV pilus assembly protein PilM
MGSIVALDIGSSSLKAVEVKSPFSHHPAVINVGFKLLPEDTIENGEIKNVPALTDAIKDLWKTAKFRGQRVIIGLDGPRTMVRQVDLPLLPIDLLRKALPLHVKNALPLSVDKFVLDFLPLRPAKERNKVNGFLVAIEDEVAADLYQACSKAGLNVYRIDSIPFALARFFAPFYAGKTTAVINIGAATTDIIVVNSDGIPDFIRQVQTGGNDITTNLMESLGLGRADAEQLKIDVGLKSMSDPNMARASEIIRKSMKAFILGVKNTVKFYEMSDDGTKVRKLIITGGTSQMEGLSQSLSMATGIPHEDFSILRGLSGVKTRISSKDRADVLSDNSNEFTAAIGLVKGKDRK